MPLYSLLLAAAFVLGAPYWLMRMLTSGRYRAGIAGRLGRVPAELRAAVLGKQVVWLHAVSVGEVLAATRLVQEFESALGPKWIIVVSTTTSTGQKLARERFQGSARVFWYPLDLAFAVRAYLRALQPRMLVLMESELWPRMLAECARRKVPVAVVNARVSDRSFARGLKVRIVWSRMLRGVTAFLAQSDEDAKRLMAIGAREGSVCVTGNLKYDVRAPKASPLAELIRKIAAGRPIIVAGSTVDRLKDSSLNEDEIVIQAWQGRLRKDLNTLLVLAPRHPQRFGVVESAVKAFPYVLASALAAPADEQPQLGTRLPDIVLLNTIGDLAGVYGIGDVAFVGGSLVPRGGHNPLEPAQFGVPVVMGPSFENFRHIVAKMQAAEAIRIVQDKNELEAVLIDLLTDRNKARAIGERGRRVFEQQQGATIRTVEALLTLVSASTEVAP